MLLDEFEWYKPTMLLSALEAVASLCATSAMWVHVPWVSENGAINSAVWSVDEMVFVGITYREYTKDGSQTRVIVFDDTGVDVSSHYELGRNS